MTESVQPAFPVLSVTQSGERIAVGILASLGAVIGGVVLTVVIWRAGFIAGFSSFVLAAGAVKLYTVGAGRPPSRGLPALLVVIVLGVAASFFAVVASDLSEIYDDVVASGGSAAISKMEFIRQGLISGDVLSAYGRDAAMFVLFAALGVFETVRRLVRPRR